MIKATCTVCKKWVKLEKPSMIVQCKECKEAFLSKVYNKIK